MTYNIIIITITIITIITITIVCTKWIIGSVPLQKLKRDFGVIHAIVVDKLILSKVNFPWEKNIYIYTHNITQCFPIEKAGRQDFPLTILLLLFAWSL